eukprot:SAG11_NODE_1339_length_5169_cov_2.613412_2_plen_230_part_00
MGQRPNLVRSLTVLLHQWQHVPASASAAVEHGAVEALAYLLGDRSWAVRTYAMRALHRLVFMNMEDPKGTVMRKLRSGRKRLWDGAWLRALVAHAWLQTELYITCDKFVEADIWFREAERRYAREEGGVLQVGQIGKLPESQMDGYTYGLETVLRLLGALSEYSILWDDIEELGVPEMAVAVLRACPTPKLFQQGDRLSRVMDQQKNLIAGSIIILGNFLFACRGSRRG